MAQVATEARDGRPEKNLGQFDASQAAVVQRTSIHALRQVFCEEQTDVGPDPGSHRARLLRGVDRLRLRLRSALRRLTMIFDYSLAALVSAGITIYLVYALLKPERF